MTQQMSVDQAVTCWICGGTTRPASTVPIPGLSQCENCGFVFSPVSALEVRDSHDDAYFEDYSDGRSYLEQEAERRYEARQRMAWLDRCGLTPPGRLLEIGSAAGHFVAAARDAGWTASGIETNAAIAEHARHALGVDVRTGSIEEQSLEPATYDVVVMWHVLEHIPQPIPTLRQLWAACKPGGCLVLEVPNRTSREARAMGSAWSHWAPHAHVSHFTPPTLQLLLEGAGFRIEQLETWPMLVYAPRLLTKLQWLAGSIKRERRLIRMPDPSRQPLLRTCARRPSAA